MSPSTSTKCVFADGVFPAPETPDFVLDIHVSGANPRRQRQNDRRRITSRIRQQGGAFDRLGVQLGQSVHRSLVEERCVVRVGIAESVHLTVRGLLQTPCAAQIDHAQAASNCLRDPLPREFVGRRQEHDVHPGLFHPLPGERLERKAAIARQLRIGFAQIGDASTIAVALHEEEQRFLDSGVMREQTHQLQAGVTGRAKHRGL